MTVRARLIAAAVLIALGAGVHPGGRAVAASDPAAVEARRLFDEAEVAYRAGNYTDALAKYQAGYAAKPLPGFLVNVAQCQRRLGDLKAARATYREFVLVAPDSRLVPEVQSLIRKLDAVIADLAAGGDGASAAELGASGDVHTTELAAPPVPPAAQQPAAAPLVSAPVSAAADVTGTDEPGAPARRSHARWWIWGGVAAAAIAGGIAAGLALSSPGTTTIHAGTLGTLSR